ncbi:MAG: PAS domain S-box protein [Anaerolineales bacterium]|uniref:ATP-binding protein n=1 Tax=Candidatus Villigracilis vicinus TaxID=3140679 RepID=UPI00313557CC|nr:PAS domain S-box protein [Anaerolineales bacterium]
MDEKILSARRSSADMDKQGGRLWNGELDYRALFEQTGDCVFIVNLDLNLVTLNPQAARLLGYSNGEYSAALAGDLFNLSDPSRRRIILENRLSVFEHVLRRKDGTLLQVELSSSLVHDVKGEPAYIQLIARDIGERKKNERLLKRNVRAQSIIGEVTAVLFRSSNIEGSMPEVLESLGYAVGVFSCVIFEARNSTLRIRHKWVDPAVPEFDAETVIMPFLDSLSKFPDRVFSVPDVPEKVSSTPKTSMLAIPIQGALGMWGFLGLFDKDDHLSWLPTSFDIVQTTANLLGAAIERMHYEETLRLSERRNRIIVDALPDLLIRVDRSGRIFDYNANPLHPLYMVAGAAVGKNLYELWDQEIAGKLLPRIPDETLFNLPRTVENFKLPGKEGVFEARLFPLSKLEALIIVRDITEQARLNQMKSDFVNWASHELRTPLTAAILMTELLRQKCTPEETEEYLGTLTNELNRQKNLINELLMAGRLENGSLRIEHVMLDLLPILKDSISAITPIAKKRNIRLAFEPTERACQVWGDVSALKQVFVNLLSNAVKFSPDGNVIEIEMEWQEDTVSVSVTDHGLGIPADAMPYLFDRFYRARNVSAAEIHGNGIGLFIVKSLLKELDGSISVDSKVNEGTTFTVILRSK